MGPYTTAKLLLDSTGSPVIMSGPDQDEDVTLVASKRDPVTGGIGLLVNGKLARFLDSTAWPMTVPSVLASPPVVTNGVGGAASAISGSILHSVLKPSKMTVLGGPISRGAAYPNYLGADMGKYPQITSTSPTAVEFNLDTVDSTGRFEIYMKGNSQQYRILIMQPSGAWASCTRFAQRTMPGDGNMYHDLVELGSAGVYQIRIEFAGGVFVGIKTTASDTVSALKSKRKRYIVVGDSFTEPTITDSGTKLYTSGGWVQQLAYLTGYDIWSAGSGGTGFVQTNGARPKCRDRLVNDVLAFNPDGVIFANGINDGSSDIATFTSEVAGCFLDCAGRELIVLSPFYPKGIEGFPVNFLQYRDVLKSQASAFGGKFLDLLSYGGIPSFISADAEFLTTVTSAYSSGTNLVVADIPTYFKSVGAGLNQWFIKVSYGSSKQAVREVFNITGTGPYTLAIGTALSAEFPVGSVVSLAGESYQTGQGRQGYPTGSGNSDRYTGAEDAVNGTHPTMAGHSNISRCVADMWSQSLRFDVSL